MTASTPLTLTSLLNPEDLPFAWGDLPSDTESDLPSPSPNDHHTCVTTGTATPCDNQREAPHETVPLSFTPAMANQHHDHPVGMGDGDGARCTSCPTPTAVDSDGAGRAAEGITSADDQAATPQHNPLSEVLRHLVSMYCAIPDAVPDAHTIERLDSTGVPSCEGSGSTVCGCFREFDSDGERVCFCDVRRERAPDDACIRCGCYREFDTDGERVCFCDRCRERGCLYLGERCTRCGWLQIFNTNGEELVPPHNVLHPDWLDCAHRNNPNQPCTRCGCSGEFDADGERVCFCDDCRDSGCVYDDDAVLHHLEGDPEVHPDAGSRDGECSVCAETTRLFPAVLAPIAEQWMHKAQCREPHLFCSECLTAWITSSLDEQTTHVMCPEPGCSAVILLDDVERLCGRKRAMQMHRLMKRDFTARDAEIQSDPELHRVLRQTAQQCPACKLWIERSDGCNHMLCSCGVAFCYACGEGYSQCSCRDGNRFDEEGYDDDDEPGFRGRGYEHDQHRMPWPADRFCGCCNSEPAMTAALERSLVLHGAPTGCVLCGCSSEMNADGDRICFCDTCREHGCVGDITH